MFINIRMKAPMQSWGNQSNTHTAGSYRGTNEFPTYSGVFGVICCCMGINRNRDYNKYKALFDSIQYVSAFATKTFNILVDNQNMGGGYNKNISYERKMVPLTSNQSDWVGMWNSNGISNAKLSDREYLEDADFIITLKVLNDIADDLINHLKRPIWSPVFGRSCCIPSTRLFVGSFNDYESCIIQTKKILGNNILIAYLNTKPVGRYNIMDMYDMPIITQAFKYTRRKVYKTII